MSSLTGSDGSSEVMRKLIFSPAPLQSEFASAYRWNQGLQITRMSRFMACYIGFPSGHLL
jgi:hypothetical protein